VAPTTGVVEVNGRVAALLELGAGFNPEFTGRENVFMYGAILGLDREEIRSRYDDIVAFADIGDYLDQPVKTYSSGMVVRLAFAVIAYVDADILIVDEALAVGDAFFVQKCMRFLREFMTRGTILFVSHDTGTVVNLCNQAVLLQKGNIKVKGSPKEVSEIYLADFYGLERDRDSAITIDEQQKAEPENTEYRDMRLDYINATRFRNDIELFEFSPETASFGTGGATIVSVEMLDVNGAQCVWIVGGEKVALVIRCKASNDIDSAIVGFYLKDSLGQYLFGDNTYLTYKSDPVTISSGQLFAAQFGFYMPLLAVGEYSIDVAIAEGTQEDHIQHRWVHDALVFKSHSSAVLRGLIGIPMHDIKITVSEA
jgi:lipopolysaccharide transport system ATP-binding protein